MKIAKFSGIVFMGLPRAIFGKYTLISREERGASVRCIHATTTTTTTTMCMTGLLLAK